MSDIHRVHAAGPANQIAPRTSTAERFEQALHRAPRDPGESGSGSDPDSDSGGDGTRDAGYPLELRGRPLPADAMRMLSASLQGGAPSDAAPDGTSDELLDALLHDIADGVAAGRNLPGSRWRLLVRLRHDLLPATEVDIGSAEGELAIVLRTSDEDAYRAIVQALPRLNQSLHRWQIAGGAATVFLVASKDLQ